MTSGDGATASWCWRCFCSCWSGRAPLEATVAEDRAAWSAASVVATGSAAGEAVAGVDIEVGVEVGLKPSVVEWSERSW